MESFLRRRRMWASTVRESEPSSESAHTELVAGNGAVGVGGEVGQEVVFLGRQAGVASVEGDLAAIDVNVDAGGAQSQAGQDVEEFLVGGGGVVGSADGCGRGVDEGHGCIRFFGAALPLSAWVYHCGGD